MPRSTIERYGCDDTAADGDNAPLSGESCFKVLSPVWIRERNPAKNHKGNNNNNKKQQRYVIEVPKGTMKDGMTNEFDAMVVSALWNDNGGDSSNHAIQIHEVWDAKATMDPPAMYDILKKKVSTLETILQPETLMNSDTKFIIQNDGGELRQVYNVTVVKPARDDAEGDDGNYLTNTPSTALPTIGLFGSRLPSPQAAAKRLQVTICESLLEFDRDTVQEILLLKGDGKVSPPRGVVMDRVTKLLEHARRIHPVIVVPSSKKEA
ncbi:MAG: hypothetical protein SGARI_005341 [Bacillariaceae sp.]